MKKTTLSLILVGMMFILLSGYFIYSVNVQGLPSYALKDSRTKEAYLFAKENPDAFRGINCHCGCMKIPHGDETRVHKDLLECFIEPEGEFESHGASCNVCVNDALYAKPLYLEGKTKSEINKIVGEIYI